MEVAIVPGTSRGGDNVRFGVEVAGHSKAIDRREDFLDREIAGSAEEDERDRGGHGPSILPNSSCKHQIALRILGALANNDRHMADDNNNSGANTILIVLVLIIVVGLVVWLFTGGFGGGGETVPDDLNVDVNLPTGDAGGGGGGE